MDDSIELRLDEINWKTVIKDLFRNILLIIMAVLIAFMGIGIYKNAVYSPRYTSSATLAVTVRGSADTSFYSSLSIAREIADVYASVFEEKVTKNKVSEAIGQKLPDSVTISAKVIPSTNLMVLDVTADTPRESYFTTLAILNNYQQIVDYIFGNAVVEVIMQPRVPIAPSNAIRAGRLTKISMLAAAVFMSGIIVVGSVLRGTAKTVRGAKRHLDGECLTVIPHEEKNKTLKSRIRNIYKGVLLTNPIISFRFEESCHQLASRIDYKLKKRGYKTILVTSVAENEGKSTVAVNLAIALAKRNKKVLVIDMDLAKPAIYKLLESRNFSKAGLINYLNGEISLDKVIQYDKKSGIYAILNAKGVGNSRKYLRSGNLRELLNICRKEFDYIILDSSPVSAGTASERLTDCVDASILVVHQDRVWMSDLNDAMETLKNGSAEFFGYVLNEFDENSRGHNKYGYGYGNYKMINKESIQ